LLSKVVVDLQVNITDLELASHPFDDPLRSLGFAVPLAKRAIYPPGKVTTPPIGPNVNGFNAPTLRLQSTFTSGDLVLLTSVSHCSFEPLTDPVRIILFRVTPHLLFAIIGEGC
jgi:hypothetical protein